MSEKESSKVPEIILQLSDTEDSNKANTPPSSTPSYVHTPAEPYDGPLAGGEGSTSSLSTSVLRNAFRASVATAITNDDEGDISSIQSEISQAPMVPGSIWYLVARSWFSVWQESQTGLVPQTVPIGPIDNSSIVDESGELLPDLEIGKELDTVPESAWEKLVRLYGIKGGKNMQVRRTGIKNNDSAILELYPPSVFVTSKEDLLNESMGHGHGSMRRIVISLSAPLSELKLRIKWAFSITDDITLFIPRNQNGGTIADQKPPPTYEAVVSVKDPSESINDQQQQQRFDQITKSGDTLLMEAGISADSPIGFSIASTITDSSSIFGPLDSTPAKEEGLSLFQPTIAGKETEVTVEIEAPLVKVEMSPHVHYLCGLNNLGNTCFMNSALQCLKHIPEMTKYFVSGAYNHEINRDNPIGMKGALATAYGRLIKSMWDIGSGTYAPRQFKQTLAQWSPQFRGYNQQDAPEFLGFLLDGMHEDLNRIIVKPYIEIPDSNGRPDAEVAKEQWAIHTQRNDSMIIDLFQGLYRSKLVCPVCGFVSVKFDPFMYLTLPLPVQRQKWQNIVFVPMDRSVHAIAMKLLVKKDDSVKQLKQIVAHLTQTKPENMIACELFNERIYTVFSDKDSLSGITATDKVFVYEVGIDVPEVVFSWSTSPLKDSPAVIQLVCSKKSAKPSTARQSFSYGFGTNSSSRYGPEIVSQPLLLTIPTESTSNGYLSLAELYLLVTQTLERWVAFDTNDLDKQLEQSLEKKEDIQGLFGLLGRAVTFKVRRNKNVAGRPILPQRNLSYISSYMHAYRSRPSSVFRVFEDHLTNDNCELLVPDSSKKPDLSSPLSSSSSSSLSLSLSDKEETSGSSSSRRRARPEDDMMDVAGSHSRQSSPYSDDNGGTPKRVRSDAGSDGENADNESSSAANSLAFVSAAESVFNLASNKNTDIGDQKQRQQAVVNNEEDVSMESPSPMPDSMAAFSNGWEASASTAAQVDNDDGKDEEDTKSLTFAEMLDTRVKLSTGDTLLCEWNEEHTQKLMDELLKGYPKPLAARFGAVDISNMFDFEDIDYYAMPTLEDANDYQTLNPAGIIKIDQPKRSKSSTNKPDNSNGQRKAITLEECLVEFTKGETLGDEDMWFCSKCKKHQAATKHFDIWRAPENLVVHLKRFQSSRAWQDKLDVYVDFPLEGLDLTRTVVGLDGKELLYDLHAICNHYGGLGGGHYTAYARNPETQKWYDFNDSSVSEVGQADRVKTAAAYMLFYRLRGSDSGAGVNIEELINKYKGMKEEEEDVNMQSPASPFTSNQMIDASDDVVFSGPSYLGSLVLEGERGVTTEPGSRSSGRNSPLANNESNMEDEK